MRFKSDRRMGHRVAISQPGTTETARPRLTGSMKTPPPSHVKLFWWTRPWVAFIARMFRRVGGWCAYEARSSENASGAPFQSRKTAKATSKMPPGIANSTPAGTLKSSRVAPAPKMA